MEGRSVGVRSEAGSTRVKLKLKKALEAKNYYEAHQLYRTLFFRLSGQCKWTELEALLYEGSILLFDAGEHGSGVDLAKVRINEKQAMICDRYQFYLFVSVSGLHRGVAQRRSLP